MYLEELILEGFKSYPVRTSITGWDPSFSAVTGLNGSGKVRACFESPLSRANTSCHSCRVTFSMPFASCWVSQTCHKCVNLTPFCHFSPISFQVRATNQQDLIYKRGQAGITRASVTAVFNNSDRSKSPVGLEQCAQITVTRQVIAFPLTFDDPSDTLSRLRYQMYQNIF